MRRRPQASSSRAIPNRQSGDLLTPTQTTGLVLSGGGARAAYQIGALKAIAPHLNKENPFNIFIGSSVGAINGLVLCACLKDGLTGALSKLEDMWRMRSFKNTFSGRPSAAFFRAVKMAVMQYLSPGPNATDTAIFNPSPLMQQIDMMIELGGGLEPDSRHPGLSSVAVMTTVEGSERKPLLFLSSHKPVPEENLVGASFQICSVHSLSAKHGFASAALPSVLPPVELELDHGVVRLVDGGISQNVPVDPAVRLGATRVILVDVSGRDWWLARYNESLDTRPSWEVPAELKTFCLRPPETFVVRCQKGLGTVLKESVGNSRSKFIAALGPVWPVFTLLKRKLGEDVAYEAMTYVALDPDYMGAIIEQGYSETQMLLRKYGSLIYERSENYESWAKSL